jgi:hypothetical protein
MKPMSSIPQKPLKPIWIRGPRLRQRWGNMPASTFHDRLKRGAIPKPEYPFGPAVPYWRMDDVERFENASKVTA